MKLNIVFDYNSSILEVDSEIVLQDIGKAMDLCGNEIIVVGDTDKIQASEEWEKLEDRVSLVHAPNTIYMNEKATTVLKKPFNSIIVAKSLLASNEASVLVSTGNTGAVGIATAWNNGLIHKKIKKIPARCNFPKVYEGLRPAICDVGSKTDVQPKHLLGYALLLMEDLKQSGIENPQLALLNIGTELGKGIKLYQEAYRLFEKVGLPGFVGNAEARQIYFDQSINGFICDGFIGNHGLKMAEATYAFMLAIDKKMGVSKEKRDVKERYVGLEAAAIILGTKHKVVLGHGGMRPLHALLKAAQYAPQEINCDQIYDTIEKHKEFLS